jgi:hypothetical protein
MFFMFGAGLAVSLYAVRWRMIIVYVFLETRFNAFDKFNIHQISIKSTIANMQLLCDRNYGEL